VSGQGGMDHLNIPIFQRAGAGGRPSVPGRCGPFSARHKPYQPPQARRDHANHSAPAYRGAIELPLHARAAWGDNGCCGRARDNRLLTGPAHLGTHHRAPGGHGGRPGPVGEAWGRLTNHSFLRARTPLEGGTTPPTKNASPAGSVCLMCRSAPKLSWLELRFSPWRIVTLVAPADSMGPSRGILLVALAMLWRCCGGSGSSSRKLNVALHAQSRSGVTGLVAGSEVSPGGAFNRQGPAFPRQLDPCVRLRSLAGAQVTTAGLQRAFRDHPLVGHAEVFAPAAYEGLSRRQWDLVSLTMHDRTASVTYDRALNGGIA
jgi:hypothetical protein